MRENPDFLWSKVVVLAFLVLISSTFAQTAVPNIAVLDFLTGSGVTEQEASTIAGRLETELMATRAFRVVERGQMDQLLHEQGFQNSGACSGTECQVQMGQLLGVERVVTGSIGKVGGIYTINAKVINVENGAILDSKAMDTRGGLDKVLTESCPALALAFAGQSKPTSSWNRPFLWVGLGALVIGGATWVALSSSQPSNRMVNDTLVIE